MKRFLRHTSGLVFWGWLLFTAPLAVADPARWEPLLQRLATLPTGSVTADQTALTNLVREAAGDASARAALEKRLLAFLQSNATFEARRLVGRQLGLVGSRKSVPVLADYLSDPELAEAARYALERLADPAAVKALVDALPCVTGSLQAGVIRSLGDLRAPVSTNLAPLITNADSVVALAAVAALGAIGDEPARQSLEKARAKAGESLRPALAHALLNCGHRLLEQGDTARAQALFERFYAPSEKPAIRAAALVGLRACDPTNQAPLVTAALRGTNDLAFRLALIRSLAERGATSALPELLRLTEAKEKAVRWAAFPAVGVLAGREELPALVKRLRQAGNEDELLAMEQTVAAILDRLEPKTDCTRLLLTDFGIAIADIRCALLRLLGRVHDAPALTALRDNLSSSDPRLQETAARVLSDWPEAAPANDLLQLARTAQSPALATLALRGYVRLASLPSQRSDEETVAMLESALALAKPPEDRRWVLGAIAGLGTVAAMESAGRQLEHPDLENDAATATVKLASVLGAQNRVATEAALRKVLALTRDEALRQQASEALKRLAK